MKRYMSKCLLALAVLQGAIPADSCVMKLAGICRCDLAAASVKAESCCHESKDAARCSKCANHAPLGNNHNKSCCAYTPAHGLTVDAPSLPSIDTHQECVPVAFTFALDLLSQATTSNFAPHAGDSPQPHDTPLYLRSHSFLI